MTNRLTVVAALVAAASLACSSQPAGAPAAQAVRKVAPARKVGTFTVSVTPIPESKGILARVEVTPDALAAKLLNVAGQFEATVTAAGGTSALGGLNPCAGPGLIAPFRIQNKAPETLANVQVQILDMASTGYEACNSSGVATSLPAPADTLPGAAFGLWSYGTLLGTATSTGGVGTFSTVNWWMKFPSNAAVKFRFAVWADAGQPELSAVGAELEVGQPVSWTSATSNKTFLEVCDADPLDPTASRHCEAQLVTSATPAPPYAFSAVPATVAGTTYFWQVYNVVGATPTLGMYPSLLDSFTAVAPLVAAAPVISLPAPASTFPADSLANALPIPLEWTTDAVILNSLYQVCTGTCPAPFAVAGDLNFANLVYEWIEPGFLAAAGRTSYAVDLVTVLPTDPLTLDTWLLPAAYTVNVYNMNDATGLTLGNPAVTSFTVAPAVAGAPVLILPALNEAIPANTLALLTPVVLEWTTDPAVTTADWQLCADALCVTVLGSGAAIGVPPVAGDPPLYSVDVTAIIPTDPTVLDLWFATGTYYWNVTNVVNGLPSGAPASSSFIVTSSMPALPVLTGPAALAPFPANTFTNALPVTLSWTAPLEVVATEVELCELADCTGALDPLAIAGGIPGVTPGTFSYDAAAVPDFTQDYALTNGGYLLPGTYYWTAYNIDPLTNVRLVPGSQRAVVIAPTPVGPAAFTLAAPTNLTRSAGPIQPSWSGPSELLATTIEVYDDALLTLVADIRIVVDDGTLQGAVPPRSHFTAPDLGATALNDNLPTYWRVIDDGLAFYYLAFPDPGTAWSATASFTIVP